MVDRVGESLLTSVGGFQRMVGGSDEEVTHQFLTVVV